MSLAEAASALNLNAEARSLLYRAIQIQRFNSGLYSAEQIPLYFELIENNVNGGNWAAVNESLDYLYWLLLEKQAGSEVIDLKFLGQRLHLLHFRPRLENGVAQPFEGTLLYSADIAK